MAYEEGGAHYQLREPLGGGARGEHTSKQMGWPCFFHQILQRSAQTTVHCNGWPAGLGTARLLPLLKEPTAQFQGLCVCWEGTNWNTVP